MNDHLVQFDLEAFEYADAGDDVLLCVTARAPGSASPTLGMYARNEVHRLNPESSVQTADGALEASYRVRARLVGPRPATYWLELDGGAVVDLPLPSPRGPSPPPPPPIASPPPPSAVASTPGPSPIASTPPPSAVASTPGPSPIASRSRPSAVASNPVTPDRPRPATTRRPRATRPQPNYRWRVRELMAERGMYSTSDLSAPLAGRGVTLSATQVYRLVTGTPERLNLRVLAALCDFFECSPNDLIHLPPTAGGRDADPRP